MAIVRSLTHGPLQTNSRHTETEATYAWVVDSDGKTYLQVDTYGSLDRQIRGKKSQSIRLSEEALSQLASIIGERRAGK
jgi:hypothetical protein